MFYCKELSRHLIISFDNVRAHNFSLCHSIPTLKCHHIINKSINQPILIGLKSICRSIIEVRVFDELTSGVIFKLTVKEQD